MTLQTSPVQQLVHFKLTEVWVFVKSVFVGETISTKQLSLGKNDTTTTTRTSSAGSGKVVTLPNGGTDTLVGKDTTDTLTNKTLTSAVLNTE